MRLAQLLFGLAAAGGSGCSLALDFSDPPGPADAAVPDAITAAACAFGEDNDTRTMAFTLAPVTDQVAGICGAGDHDFYAVQVAAGQTLSFQITFPQEGPKGDLDMRLLDESDAIVARSVSADADEGLICPGGPPNCPTLTGNYFVEVFGFNDSTENAYVIDYVLTGP
jgi:hypothetical protein